MIVSRTTGRAGFAERRAVLAVLTAWIVLAAICPAAYALAAAAPSKAKVHGIAISGRVSKVEAAAKRFGVVDGSGHEVVLVWTAATRITGGDIKPGEIVTVRYLDKDKTHIATTVHVGTLAPSKAPASAAATAAPPPSSSPAPR